MKRILCVFLLIAMMVGVMGAFTVSADNAQGLNEFEQKHNISYYAEYSGSPKILRLKFAPSWEVYHTQRNTRGFISKICSFEELVESYNIGQDADLKYNNSFFEDKFIVVFDWEMGSPGCKFRVTDVCVEDGLINIKIIQDIYQMLANAVVESGNIILEMDRELIDKDVSVTITDAFGEVPKTGVPDAMGAIVVIVTLLPISAALWCCILRLRLKRGNNGNG